MHLCNCCIYGDNVYIVRSVWLAVVVLSLLAFFYTAYECVQLYVKERSLVVTSGPQAHLPSITICNVNQLRSIIVLL